MNISALCIKAGELGAAFYNSSLGLLSVSSFSQFQFRVVATRIAQVYNPSLFLIQENLDDNENYDISFLENDYKINILKRKSQNFSFKGGLDAINSMIFLIPKEQQREARNEIISGIVDITSKAVVGAINAIFMYLNDESDNDFTVSCFKLLEIPRGLYLPKYALEELQIFSYDLHPSIHIKSHKMKDGLSLYSLFNRCSTTMGRVFLRKYLLITYDDVSEINKRLDLIESFVKEDMHPHVNEIILNLHTLPEIRHILVKLEKESMTAIYWQRLHKGLMQAATICKVVERLKKDVNVELYDELCEVLCSKNGKQLVKMGNEIESTIDLTNNSEIIIRDDFDAKLKEMRDNYSKLGGVLTEIAKKLMKALPSKSLIHELCVVFIPEHKFLTKILKCPSMTPFDIPEDYSIFFETETHYYCKNSMMQELDEKLGDIDQNIASREILIMISLSDKILNYSSLINRIWEKIGVLDGFCALSVVAVESRFVRPIITNEKDLIIKNGRHPLLEKCVESIVPNSTISLSNESPIHIITGPNSSGKSIYLKQIALIVYLSHIGSFVPAEKATIPLTDNIMCLFQNTISESNQLFSSAFIDETRKISEAIQRSTSRSLIIIDEFGKKSNSIDGASLLCGVIKYLFKKSDMCPKTFISTHFYNILNQKILDPHIYIHCKMKTKIINNEKDNESKTIVFLYNLEKCDENNENEEFDSFGLHCAQRAGLSKSIIKRAKEIVCCIQNSEEIPKNPECFDSNLEKRSREALSLFFNYDPEKQNPRKLLQMIEKIIYDNT